MAAPGGRPRRGPAAAGAKAARAAYGTGEAWGTVGSAAREIEVVHGYVIVSESPTPQHQQVARRLATALETARPNGVVLAYPFKVAVPFEELIE